MCDGATYSEIAAAMGVSHETVRMFVRRARTKLGMRRRTNLVVWALTHQAELKGLLHVDTGA